MALAGSGLPSDEFSFLGFAPARTAERRRWVENRVAPERRTVVMFEAPGRINGLLSDLFEVLGNRDVVVARELTKLHESWLRGRLSDLTRESGSPPPERGEYVVLLSALGIGPVGAVPSDEDVSACYRRISDEAGDLSRRDVVRQVAEAFALPPKEVYAIIERTKSSVE